MTREEKIAQLVLRKNGLQPPYDLLSLVKKKANISFKSFPFKADGITVDIKSNKPQIYINSLVVSQARRNFTIAHELGHIFIPWHKGTIVSEENYSISNHYLYRDMEAEANRFASELLMPSDWIRGILKSEDSFESKLHKIIINAKVSLEAALIKIENLCDERRYILQFDESGRCIKEYVGVNVRSLNKIGKKIEIRDILGVSKHESFLEKGALIETFIIEHADSSEFDHDDQRPWRAVLKEMLEDCNCSDKIQNINAIANWKVNDMKKQGITDIKYICGEVKLHFNGRIGLDEIIKHNLFSVYIRKRVEDLLSNKK